MSWVPPRDAYDPDRFLSGDAIRDRLATLPAANQRNGLLLSLDLDQLRPFVVLALLQMNDGGPSLFYQRAIARLARVWSKSSKQIEETMITRLRHRDGHTERAEWRRLRKLPEMAELSEQHVTDEG